MKINMKKNKEKRNVDNIQLQQQVEVLTMERDHLKYDIKDLQRIIVSQAHEIERLRGMSKSMTRIDEYMTVYDKYNVSYKDMDLPETV